MDARIAQLKSLPQRPSETWQGGLTPMRGWVSGEGDSPYRPIVPLWVAVQEDKVHLGSLLRPNESNLAVAVEALLSFAFDSKYGGYRPGHIEVADGALIQAHLLLRRHGQELCRRSEPLCVICPLARDCEYYQRSKRKKPKR